MSSDDQKSFLKRWSQRKLAKDGTHDEAPPLQPAVVPPAQPAAPLPELGSLNMESDFQPFMHPEVYAGIRNSAMRVLFRAPHFNVMDGLDTYIDDYGRPDPLPDDMLRGLSQFRALFGEGQEKQQDNGAQAPEAAEQDKVAFVLPEQPSASIDREKGGEQD